MTTRLNVQFHEGLQAISELPVATEVEAALKNSGWDPGGQGLLTMGAALSVTLTHLIEVANSRGSVRTQAYANFCMSLALARMAYDSGVVVSDEMVFTTTEVGLLNFLEQFSPKSEIDAPLAESRLSIVCDHHTGALARSYKGHSDRLLRIHEED